MYNASAQFHSAVFENSPTERVLFRFADGTIFTNEDIHIGNGLKVIEAANLEEELTIGACPASSLEATIMNYHGLLSGFAFGEAEISLGVRTERTAGIPVNANAVAYLAGRQLCGYSTVPYLKIGGEVTAAQPGFPVHAIVADGLDVYCIGLEGQCWKATLSGGALWNALEGDMWNELEGVTWESLQGTLAAVGDISLSDFMTAKATRLAAEHRGLWYNSDVLYEYFTDGTTEKYEYVKLGTFLLNTPTKRKVNLISVSALDRMSLFDIEADDFWNGLTFPITIGEIFTQLCAFIGVPKATMTFINSTRSFSEAPIAAEGITAREILGWIAGAACSFARMTRDGEVELAWFGEEAVEVPMNQYFSIDAAEYEVAPIDKLQILGSETDIGVIIGEGTNGYQLMDNPLLYGETDTEIRTYGTPIYNRLIAFDAFKPIVARAVCDWSIQAGDIISIVLNETTYAFPVYCQTIVWKGTARATYESTGAERRPVLSAVNRRTFSQRRVMHEITVDVNGIMSRLTDAEGNIASLELTVDEFELEFVSKDGVIASINASAELIKIAAENIALEGIVTANSNFKVLLDGSIEAINGKFSGQITASAGTIGGWTIASNNLYSGSNYLAPNYVRFGDWVFSADGVDGPGFNVEGDAYYDVATIVLGGGTIDGFSDGGIIINGITLDDDISLPARLYMDNPPTASGSANVRLVDQSSTYSLGIITSSRLFKKDITDTGDLGTIIDALRPIAYTSATEPEGGRFYGLIAEEVAEVDPLLVDYRHYDGEIRPMSVQYDRLTVPLLQAVKDLRKRVSSLEEKTL
jgi:hypothetical protein